MSHSETRAPEAGFRFLKVRHLVPVLFIAALLICHSSWSVAASAEAPQTISVVSVEGLYSISEDELLYLLDLGKDKALDGDSLRRGIKRAFLKGIFDDIRVERRADSPGSLHVVVKEKGIIESISIEGNEHFSKRFVRRNLGIKTGERYSEHRVAKAVGSLKRKFGKRGFPEAEVSFGKETLKENKVVLSLLITEGAPQIIREVRITESDDVVKSRLHLGKGDIFDRTVLDKLSDKLATYYRKEGYIKTTLSYTFSDGVLDIRFAKGRKLVVAFEGNEALSTGALKRELTFSEINDFSMDLLEEAVTRIVTLYRKRGYPQATLAPAVSTLNDTITVNFYVFEGDHQRIGSITFEGTTLPEDDLLRAIASKKGNNYDPDEVDADVERLREHYRSQGFLRAEVGEPVVEASGNEATVRFIVREGQQFRLSDVVIKGAKAISTGEIMREVGLACGTPYNEVFVYRARRKILDLYHKKGFLDASVTVQREVSGTAITAIFTIEEDGLTLAGKTIIRGNELTKRQIIMRELHQQEDRPLDQALMVEGRYNLYRTGLFTDIGAQEAEEYDLYPGEQWERPHTQDILYTVTEGNPGIVEFGLGYGEYERYRGFFDVTYKNLWGLNRQITFRTEISTLIQRLFVSYVNPWFKVKDLTFKAIALYENRKELNFDTHDTLYRSRRYSLTAGIEKKFSEKLKGELYHDISQVETFDVAPDVILSKEDTGHLLISSPRVSIIYDRRDNPFDPRQGFLVGASFEVASKLFLSSTEYVKLSGYFNHYIGLSKRVVFATSVRSGIAEGFGGTSELPIVERYFLGGRTTVRGYKQDGLGPKGSDGNPTGGNAFAMFNAEFRINVWKGLGLVTFVDGGNVWQKINQMDIGDLKYSTGLGLRYATPVGPVSVDYGYKLNRDEGESKGEIHFSLGYTF